MRPWHFVVIIVVIFLLFGWKKLPDAARAVGRSLRIFKAETKELLDDDVKGKAEAKTARQGLSDDSTPHAARDEETDEAVRPTSPLSGEVLEPKRQPREQR